MSARNSRHSPVMFFVAGPSGGGKSTFVQILSSLLFLLGDYKVLVLSTDDYYCDLSHLPPKKRTKVNFDTPRAIDFELLYTHLLCIRDGRSFQKPRYSFVIHAQDGFETINPSEFDVIIIEGILVFTDQRIVQLAGEASAFVDVAQAVCFLRRLIRDRQARGRSTWSVTTQYLKTVLPGWLKYVEPSAKHAKIRVRGGGYDPVGILNALTFLKRELEMRK